MKIKNFPTNLKNLTIIFLANRHNIETAYQANTGEKVFYLKSHPFYGTFNYLKNQEKRQMIYDICLQKCLYILSPEFKLIVILKKTNLGVTLLAIIQDIDTECAQ